tara:strand:- start:250 stop:783 length:534 start_codon:yes stop_codon:yes gene_type:complete
MDEGGYYRKLFYQNMKDIYGYTKEDMKDFICIGSSKTHTDIPCGLEHKISIPALVSECVCTHDIEENCWIWNEKTNEVITIGNECVKKFLPEGNGKVKRCGKCFKQNRKRKSNFCDECIIKIQQEERERDYMKKILEQEKKRKAREAGTYKLYCLDCNRYNPGYPRCFSCNQELKKS